MPEQSQPQTTPNDTAASIVPIDEERDGSKLADKRETESPTATEGDIEKHQKPKQNGLSGTELYEDTVAEAASGSQIPSDEATVHGSKEEPPHDDQVASSSGAGQESEQTADRSETPSLQKPLIYTVIHRVSATGPQNFRSNRC